MVTLYVTCLNGDALNRTGQVLDDLEGLRDGYGAEAVGVLRHDERLLLRGTGDLQVSLSFQRKFKVASVDQMPFLDRTLPKNDLIHLWKFVIHRPHSINLGFPFMPSSQTHIFFAVFKPMRLNSDTF